MSLGSIANRPQSRRALRYQANMADALQESRDFLEGVWGATPPHLLSSEEVGALGTGDMTRTEVETALEGKATSSKWIGWKLWRQANGQDSTSYTFGELLKRWNTRTIILRWMRHNEDLCLRCGLATTKDKGYYETPRFYPDSLLDVGVDGPRSAAKFCGLYEKVRRPHAWDSSKQICHEWVKAVGTPNYNRLPDWVKRDLVYAPSHAKIGGDRIGNIWDLPIEVKAWRWGSFPKQIAKKIGKLPVRSRLIAGLAWRCFETEWENLTISRTELINKFWIRFRELSQNPSSALLWLIEADTETYGYDSPFLMSAKRSRIALEILLELPHGALEEEWEEGDRHDYDEYRPSESRAWDILANYGSPEDVCKSLLGCSGKGTLRAYAQCQYVDSVRWAGALAYGNPDAVQKILVQSPQISFQKDAVGFLNTLPMSARIRLLGCTTFKYKGQIASVTNDHVRDTGYLWSNIKEKPELGRIRNWFSVHEQLSAAFVEELPDEELPTPWGHLDGLAAVDGSWEIEIPKRVATLKYWGQVLSNCIGGYGPAIKQGRSIIFAVKEQGRVTHCVEYCSDRCNQFYSYGNGSPDTAIELSVTQALQQAIT